LACLAFGVAGEVGMMTTGSINWTELGKGGLDMPSKVLVY